VRIERERLGRGQGGQGGRGGGREGFHSARANLYSISQLRMTFNARLLLGATITLLYGRRKLILMICPL